MKKILIISIFIILCFSNCDKEDSTKPYTGVPVITFSLTSNNSDPGLYLTRASPKGFPSEEFFIFRMSNPKSQTIYSFEIVGIDIYKGIGKLSITMPKNAIFYDLEYVNGTALPEQTYGSDPGRKVFSMNATKEKVPLTIRGKFTVPSTLPANTIWGDQMIAESSIYGYPKNISYSNLDWTLMWKLSNGLNYGANKN